MFRDIRGRTKEFFYSECVYCTSTRCDTCLRRRFSNGEVCQSDIDISVVSACEDGQIVLSERIQRTIMALI